MRMRFLRLLPAALLFATFSTPASGQVDVEILFRVDMTVQADLGGFDPRLDMVVVRGGFNDWGCTGAMVEIDDGIFALEVEVLGHTIGEGEYKYNINCGEGGFGRWEDSIPNRRYSVTGAETDTDGDGLVEVMIDQVFFDDVQAGADAEILFQVDMSVQIALGRFDPDVEDVVVRGSFNGWACTEPMQEVDDGVFSIEIEVPGHAFGVAFYKFNIGCVDDGWEDGRPNREYLVSGAEPDEDGDDLLDIVTPLVFFEDTEPGPNVEFLFRVDMEQMIAAGSFVPKFDDVVVRGTFNSWTCSEPFEDDDLFVLRVESPRHPLGPGTYRFGISCADDRWEQVIAERVYVVTGDEPDTDGNGFLEITPEVARFDEIDAAAIDAEIRFRVDMSLEAAAGRFDPTADTVVVRGDLNDWQCSEAMAPIGDDVFEIELQVAAHPIAAAEFKFNVGCGDDGWESEIGNRLYAVLGDEVDLDDDGYVDIVLDTAIFNDRVPAGVGPFIRGDCGQAGRVSISSGITLLGWLFQGQAEPACLAACDADGDGRLDLSTAVYVFNALFLGGPLPPAPQECASSTQASDIELGCREPAGCG